MKIKDFEVEIQKEIDKELVIKTNPNAKDIAGVYWKGMFIGVSVPPEEIYEEMSMARIDATGTAYKTIGFAKELIEGKLKKLKRELEEDPDLFTD